MNDARSTEPSAGIARAQSGQTLTLLPCPFCGGKATLTNVRMSGHIFKVGCYNELCWRPGTDGFDREDHATAAWNSRPALSEVHPEGAQESLKSSASGGRDAGEEIERALNFARQLVMEGRYISVADCKLNGLAPGWGNRLKSALDRINDLSLLDPEGHLKS